MKLLGVLALLVALAAAERPYRSRPIIEYINSIGTTWTAGVNRMFEGRSKEDIRALMGVDMEGERERLREMPIHDNADIPDSDIPDEFDARKQWPKCATMISNIRDQSACGSCWAVAAAGTMSDRICIASDGAKQVNISAGNLMSCCNSCGFGCGGGYPSAAWNYFKSTGLVSGGSYGDKNSCQPYPLPHCEHHNSHTTYPPCPHQEYDTPKCSHDCQSGYSTSYNQDKHRGKSSYGVSSAVTSIQKEIMTYGPVEASYSVYEDFLSYTGGVYQHKTGGYDGGHAVRMIGWGVEDGTPYWLIANSWNEDWGVNGYFKILRGKNECGIEGGITAGHMP